MSALLATVSESLPAIPANSILPTKSLVVFLVCADFARRFMVRSMLEYSNYSVLEFDDSQQALKHANFKAPDLFILDAGSTGSDCCQTCRAIRQGSATRNSALVAILDTGNADLIEQLLDAGMSDYLLNPLDFDAMGLRVRSILHKWKITKALRENEERYSLVLHGTQQGLWDWDLRTGQVFYSPRWHQILGYSGNEFPPSPDSWFEIIHPHYRNQVTDLISSHLKGHTSHFYCEYQIRHKLGHYLWVLSRGIAERNEKNQPIRVAGSLSNITARKLSEQQLMQQANFDEVTGLMRRHLLQQEIQQSILDCTRTSSRFALIYVDIDRFSAVKNAFGYDFCNRLIKAFAERLLATVAEATPVSRFECDGYAILLSRVDNVEYAVQAAKEISRALQTPFTIDGRTVQFGVTSGMTMGPENYTEAEIVVRDTLMAVTRAKKRRNNEVVVFDESMYIELRKRLECETELRLAVSDGDIVPYYQPIVRLSDGGIHGFEALMRWQHPLKGMIAPDEFLDVAEETGLIVDIDDIVLQHASLQACAWSNMFDYQTMVMHVNLCGRQLTRPLLIEHIEQVLRQTRLPPANLSLEVTETALIEDAELAVSILQRLVSMGAQVSMDDFGAGYSSLNYLQKFPFTTLKLDRAFISLILDSKKTADIVRSTIKLAHQLNIKVVAEGVETEQQADLLRTWRCDYGQGYLFGRPMPAESAEKLIEQKLLICTVH
ncbi:MAG: EAL domain-containing protein [Methylococcaceae bacterium]|nr:MAG: EAL domain-containing protein [Methylococcaceae bacterium]